MGENNTLAVARGPSRAQKTSKSHAAGRSREEGTNQRNSCPGNPGLILEYERATPSILIPKHLAPSPVSAADVIIWSINVWTLEIFSFRRR
jgi:hypothetical protein